MTKHGNAPPARAGYEMNLGRFRAVPRAGRFDDDPSPMVQELIARLRFAADHVPLEGRDILDYGCGTGVALEWIRSAVSPGRLVGLDASEAVITFARQRYSGIDFRALDIESPAPDLDAAFDIAVCFEVLEHLADPGRALEHLVSHYLRPGGTLLVTTPNRLVFSAGMEPSPINRTHIHEMDLEEFRHLLARWFGEVEVWGMRFQAPERMAAYARSVRNACDGYRRLGELWWNPLVSRIYCWVLRGGLWELAMGRQFRRWSAADFAFERESPERAIWFFAVAGRPHQGGARHG